MADRPGGSTRTPGERPRGRPPEEAELVAWCAPADQADAYTRLWTRKEACVKAADARLVQGLRLPVGTRGDRMVDGRPVIFERLDGGWWEWPLDDEQPGDTEPPAACPLRSVRRPSHEFHVQCRSNGVPDRITESEAAPILRMMV